MAPISFDQTKTIIPVCYSDAIPTPEPQWYSFLDIVQETMEKKTQHVISQMHVISIQIPFEYKTIRLIPDLLDVRISTVHEMFLTH